MRTDWSKRSDPRGLPELRRDRPAHAGPDAEAVRFLVEQRDVLGFGTEAIGTDAGQGSTCARPTRATTTCTAPAATACSA